MVLSTNFKQNLKQRAMNHYSTYPPKASRTKQQMPSYIKSEQSVALQDLDESSLEEYVYQRRHSSTDSTGEDDEFTPINRQKQSRLNFTHLYRRKQKMSNIIQNDHLVNRRRNSKKSQRLSDFIDIGIRVLLVIIFIKMEFTPAFQRVIHMEELWMYKNPRTKDYISPAVLLVSVTMGPLLISLIHFILTKNQADFAAATWTWTLSLCLTGFTTGLLKITIGRPRPDYFYRCFPDGVMHLVENNTHTQDLLYLFDCTGSIKDIEEGRKSFPSGHSSFAFCSFGFISYYLAAKLHVFNRRGKGNSWRLCITILPLIAAALVAISRICDYHHHWQDVTVGSIIGAVVSYTVYRQYYPSLCSLHSNHPYSYHVYDSICTRKSYPAYSRKRLPIYKRFKGEESGHPGVTHSTSTNTLLNLCNKIPPS